jgi:small subunit ribosomal protein S20
VGVPLGSEVLIWNGVHKCKHTLTSFAARIFQSHAPIFAHTAKPAYRHAASQKTSITPAAPPPFPKFHLQNKGFAFFSGNAIIQGFAQNLAFCAARLYLSVRRTKFPKFSTPTVSTTCSDSGNSMANIKSAAKRAKQATVQRAHNMAQRTQLRTAIKKIVAAVASGDKAAAEAAFQANVGTIDSIADKKIIHKNKAARHKSRLTKAIKAIGQQAAA